MLNNLFSYATNELSQDAFLCWLLSFAVKGCNKDAALKSCAQEFLRIFTNIPENEDIYLSEPPQRQYKHIDILLTVNNRYKVIIEDKTYTSEHNDQLKIYWDTVRADFSFEEIVDVYGVYFKTGYQSDLSAVEKAGYLYFGRDDILSILQKYADTIQNDIFQDYYAHLESFAQAAGTYSKLPIREWGWQQVYEFYEACKKELSYTNMGMQYGYVHNPSGGLDAMWIYHKDCFVTFDNLQYELYLQCEFASKEMKIRYRASALDDKIYGERRDRLIWKQKNGQWEDVAKDNNFIKAGKYGSGKSVALGVYREPCETADGALQAIKHAILDFKKLVAQIKEDTSVMSDVIV